MADFFMKNHRGIYSDDPEAKMQKGEVAGRLRCMMDRYDTGENADAIGDNLLVGGILPPNLVVVDAWIKVNGVLDAGVTLTLLSKITRTEAQSESNNGAPIAEGIGSTLIAAKAFDVETFVRMGLGNVAEEMPGKRLGFEAPAVGTQFMVQIGGAPILTNAKITVFIMYASD